MCILLSCATESIHPSIRRSQFGILTKPQGATLRPQLAMGGRDGILYILCQSLANCRHLFIYAEEHRQCFPLSRLRSMGSSLETCSWLASCVLEEACISLHLPYVWRFLVHLLQYNTYNIKGEMINSEQLLIFRVVMLVKHRSLHLQYNVMHAP